jgi:hypothetical protein
MRTTMPTDNPASLPRETYLDILTFMLRTNEFPAGETELLSDPAALRAVRITSEPDA